MVGRDVDRPAPRALDADASSPGSRRRSPASARAAVGASREKRSSIAPAEADRARCRCPSARARRSSCGSSAGTCARRRSPRRRSSRSPRAAPAPARSARRTSRSSSGCANRRPARQRRVRRDDDLRRAENPARRLELVRRAARTPVTGVSSCSVTPASSAARRSARTSRAGCTVAHSGKKTPPPEDGRARRAAAPPPRSSDRLLRPAHAPRRGDGRSTAASCAGAAETSSIPASRSQTSSPRASPHARMPGMIRSPARASSTAPSSPSTGRSPGERRPVAVEEAAVAPARPVPADLRLEQRDAQLGRALPQRQRRPEPRVAAADDRNVGDRVPARAGRRRLALRAPARPRPPRRQARLDRWGRQSGVFRAP